MKPSQSIPRCFNSPLGRSRRVRSTPFGADRRVGSERRLRSRSCLHDRKLHVEKTPDSREATIGGSNPSANTGPAVLQRANSVLRKWYRTTEIHAQQQVDRGCSPFPST